jgi:hypothetical protein
MRLIGVCRAQLQRTQRPSAAFPNAPQEDFQNPGFHVRHSGRVSSTCSVRTRQVSHREFNLTVRKLPPVLDDWYETALRKLIDEFTNFTASRVNRQRKYLWLPRARQAFCQIARANEHVGPPKVACIDAPDHERLIAKL